MNDYIEVIQSIVKNDEFIDKAAVKLLTSLVFVAVILIM